MSNSSLVNYVKISPNRTSPRRNKIDRITIHHMAGNLTVETCGNVFAPKSRQASSNYGISSDGRVGMYVEEKDRSWCSSSRANDHRAITIEVADNAAGPGWGCSSAAMAKLILLCADICRRNGIKKLNYTGNTNGNLTLHKWFASTDCPGAYLESQMPKIASEVNKLLASGATSYTWNGATASSGSTSAAAPAVKPATKSSGSDWVRRLQKECNAQGFSKQVVDGIPGKNTLAGCPTCRKGARGNITRLIQEKLNALGYNCGKVDGIFGIGTENAVKACQKAKGLPADGIVGQNTWRKLLGL